MTGLSTGAKLGVWSRSACDDLPNDTPEKLNTQCDVAKKELLRSSSMLPGRILRYDVGLGRE